MGEPSEKVFPRSEKSGHGRTPLFCPTTRKFIGGSRLDRRHAASGPICGLSAQTKRSTKRASAKLHARPQTQQTHNSPILHPGMCMSAGDLHMLQKAERAIGRKGQKKRASSHEPGQHGILTGVILPNRTTSPAAEPRKRRQARRTGMQREARCAKGVLWLHSLLCYYHTIKHNKTQGLREIFLKISKFLSVQHIFSPKNSKKWPCATVFTPKLRLKNVSYETLSARAVFHVKHFSRREACAPQFCGEFCCLVSHGTEVIGKALHAKSVKYKVYSSVACFI